MDTQRLRAWQRDALEKYRVSNRRDFVVTATPGAGKTTFALTLAAKLKAVGQTEQIIVVAPTDHLRTQWANEAGERGIFLDPTLSNRATEHSSDYVGYVITYAQAAQNPLVHNRRVRSKKTLVIFDEIHHAGDGLSWGEAVRTAFAGAHRRLSLTGTPFRTSPSSTIPFVHYEPQSDGTLLSATDFSYGYGDALRDHVVRPVTFAAYSGETSWEVEGETFSSSLADADNQEFERRALRAALDPSGSWIPHVFRAAHERLLETRKSGMPDAGGMILASDQENAKAYADIIESISGEKATVVVSDDPRASQKIDQFKLGDDKWLVAVRMVSEGVDVPRLAVGVWATNYRTPLFFAQAVGRFVRSRSPHEHATVFMPAIKPLIALASEMEAQRNHAIKLNAEGDDLLEDQSAPDETDGPDSGKMVSVGSSAAFDHVLFNGKALDGLSELSPEDENYIGLPGLLSPGQMAAILRTRDTQIRAEQANSVDPSGKRAERLNIHAAISSTRADINRLVSRIAATRGMSHAHLHKLTQKAVPGPPSSTATLKILEERKEWLQKKTNL